MLWIAVHLPLLSLEAFCATLAEPARAAPIALVEGHQIRAANGAALQLGVRPGHKRATALALAPALTLGQADAARDARALAAVAHAALAYTPMVALEPAAVLLEVQASLRYFGGAPALLTRLRASLAPLGHRVQIASAPTPLGASLLARWRRDLTFGPHSTDPAALGTLLDAAPVGLLAAAADIPHREALPGMGLSCIADLRRLPRAGLARRFGEGLLVDLDRALGSRADPREPVALPERFESRLELYARADTTAQLLHAAAVLLARLVAWARAQQARVAAFTLEMLHDDRAPAGRLTVTLAEPSCDAAHLQVLLRERLARLVLPAPALELRLHCEDLARRPAPNGELFPTPASERASLVRLIEQLQARLGPQGVLRIVQAEDHRPERASSLQPVAVPPPRLSGAATQASRPVWLLPEPLPLAERESLPLLEGRPLQLLCGPERIETGWWDGAAVARDYYIAQDEGGALVWLYRGRLPRDAGQGWMLQGRFG